MICILGFWNGASASGSSLVARSAEGRTAWTVCREVGNAAMTELWVKERDGDARRMGIFPGRAAGLAWRADGMRILYRDTPLALTRLNLPGLMRQASPLVAGETWEVTPDGEVARPLLSGEVLSEDVVWTTAGDSSVVPAEPPGTGADVQPVLAELAEVFKTAAMAHSALQRWEFDLARTRFRQAAQQFEALPRKHTGLFWQPFMNYARALAVHSGRTDEEAQRWVCSEHLSAIGDLLKAYEQEHGGRVAPSLEAVQKWAEGRVRDAESRSLKDLFRSPADPVENRISYFYRAEAAEGEAVSISPFYPNRLVELVRKSNGFEVRDRAIGKSQVDSLLALGNHLLKTDGNSSIPALEMVTRVAPKFALGHCRLGYAYLKANRLDQALASFEHSTKLDHRLAEAYNGIGLVFQEKPKGLYTAIHYFQKALRHDRDYLQARYNMALVRHQMDEHDVKRDVERILEIDPAFAPAYKLLGQWYEVQQEDYERAAVHFARYMALDPDDPEGRRLLANAYLRAKNYDRIVELLTDYIRLHPDEVPVLAVLAQACVQMKRLAWADQYFNQYLEAVDADERKLYEDAKFLMSGQEANMYARTAGEERKEFLNRFWAGHDPDLTTTINERRLEHYRRVWYARQNFSGGKQPWDRRGEVYIRFGEPDFRSRSDMQNFDQSLKVQQVRERIARHIYGSAAQKMSFVSGPVYAVRSLKANLGAIVNMASGYGMERLVEVLGFAGNGNQQAAQDEEATVDGPRLTSGLTAEGELTGESLELMRSEVVRMSGVGPMGDGLGGGANHYSNFKPVTSQEDASMVPWETWVYTDINGGMEITFTDERLRGDFDYAPPPMDPELPFQLQVRFNQYNPRRIVEQAALVTPDHYMPPDGAAPLEFYYDLAHFRAKEKGEALLEVYLGVPYGAGKYLPDRDETSMVVERSVAVLNESNGAVFRREGDMVFRSDGDLTRMQGGFVPDVVSLSVPPGEYRLEVRMKDRLSGRQGRYRQDIVVNDFSRGGLRISELELAWRVQETQEEGKFTKGGLQVIPIPTRTFGAGQSVFVYYEVYNLKADEFDQTRYRVEYTIGPRDSSGRKAEGVISRLVRVFSSEERRIAVGYEQLGEGESERAYMELDLSSASAGKHWLKVEVTDLNTGQTTFREASFEVKE